MSDAELIARSLGGEEGAFDLLAGRWQHRLYNFIVRYIGGDREEAQDLCQQTLLRAYQGLGRLREPEHFSTWLYQIAVNACRDEFSRRKQQPTVSVDEVGDLVDPKEGGAERGAMRRDLRDWLARGLQAIPEEQRLVVVMKEYQQLKFTEIADILKVPLQTVKSRLYYGLNNLRKVLAGWQISQETLDHEL